MRYNFIISLILILLTACGKSSEKPLLQVLTAEQTGIQFSNNLTATNAFNMFKYMYFYNGAGVGVGDFNNDGLQDVFFASNQSQNSLYLNKGNFTFEDVTSAANIPLKSGWSTGISVVDINNDGLLDIYVCKVSAYEGLTGANELLICKGLKNGIPTYVNEAEAYGINFKGFSTQAAFFDMDVDGDLDMYLLNHAVHHNGTFAQRSSFYNTTHPTSGDRLYRNDNGKYIDVTATAGINSTAIGYGLGIAINDVNNDGYPDIYVGNDFHENDYLYINQKNGTFKEALNEQIQHTSQFSMGVDMADLNNDAQTEIISMDMLPDDPYILKRSLGEDAYDIFQVKLKHGYNHQYARNNLQLNRGNGKFSEVGLYAGIYATDWSWAPLLVDLNNDGLKDIFITNGIPKRLNDIDYVNYVSNEEVQAKIRTNTIGEKDMAVINHYPEIKLPNKVYLNQGNVQFTDAAASVADNIPTFSNGAAYADFDNDGDIDIIVNNINDKATIYRNTCNDAKQAPSITITLKGNATNNNAIGARVLLYTNKQVLSYEKQPVRGFQSSMEVPLQFALPTTAIDSAILIWPDNTYQYLTIDTTKLHRTLTYQPNLPTFNFKQLQPQPIQHHYVWSDITKAAQLQFTHQENSFVEFDREQLIPWMVSKEGPALAIADVNADGLHDIFIGGARDQSAALLMQQPNGTFHQRTSTALMADSSFEDVAATFADINNDGSPDLLIASGGNEFYGNDEHNQPRLYLNDGKGNFSKQPNAFNGIFATASCIVTADFNSDGWLDVFIGARAQPNTYGSIPESYLAVNDGKGNFKKANNALQKIIARIGLVTDAVATDINSDAKPDLFIATEWGHIYSIISSGQAYTQATIGKKGLWHKLLLTDINADGIADIVAGNLGLNSRLKATEQHPIRLYINDFDGNGITEQILTYYLNGKEIPFANKDELQKQLPILKKKFLYAEAFAKADLPTLLGADKLKAAQQYTVTDLANAVFLGNGKGAFTQLPTTQLPYTMQLAPLRAMAAIDKTHVLLAGNFYDNNIQMGRYDADYGLLLQTQPQYTASLLWQPNKMPLPITDQVRNIARLQVAGKQAVLLAKNNAPLQLLLYEKLP
ncbi:MAG: VCBS repeat-containing protein [Chitinophagaceae bacterium]